MLFLKIIKHHWFLVALLLAMAAGFWLASPMKMLASAIWLKWLIVAATMLMMTWPLETGKLLESGSKPVAPLIATFLNLAVAPLLAWPISKLLGADLGAGLILAAAVPSTLASAAVWTRRAGGNDAIAIMVTIITNLFCFVVTPAWVFFLIQIEMPQELLVATIRNLLFYVVLPMIIGQLLRLNSSSAKWATSHKPTFSIIAQVGILCIVLLGSISMRLRLSNHGVGAIQLNLLAATIVSVLVLHLSILLMGIQLGRWTGHSKPDQIAIAFAGSQKTLMVGLSTALSMGLNIIPIVAYHALQLIVDTLIADQFRHRNEAESS